MSTPRLAVAERIFTTDGKRFLDRQRACAQLATATCREAIEVLRANDRTAVEAMRHRLERQI